MIRWRHDQQNLAVDYDTGSIQLTEEQRQPLERAAAFVRKRCHDLSGPALHVRINRDERGAEFEVELALDVMQRSLKGIGKADTLPDAVEYARDKILSQMGPFKAALRREEIYRLQHHENLADPAGARTAPAPADSPQIRKFENDLEAYWRPLVRQISREISALEMSNLLPPRRTGSPGHRRRGDRPHVRAVRQAAGGRAHGDLALPASPPGPRRAPRAAAAGDPDVLSPTTAVDEGNPSPASPAQSADGQRGGPHGPPAARSRPAAR